MAPRAHVRGHVPRWARPGRLGISPTVLRHLGRDPSTGTRTRGGESAPASAGATSIPSRADVDTSVLNIFPLIAVMCLIVSLCATSVLQRLPALSWLPWRPLTLLIGRCSYTFNGTDQALVTLSWAFVLVAAVTAPGSARAARALASAALAVSLTSASMSGGSWFEGAILGSAKFAVTCPPQPPAAQLGLEVDRALYYAALFPGLAAGATLLSLAAFDHANDPLRRWATRREWPRWGGTAVVVLLALLVAVIPYEQLELLKSRLGGPPELPMEPIIWPFALACLAALVPQDRIHRVGIAGVGLVGGLAFGQWASVEQMMQQHTHILDPHQGTGSAGLNYINDVSAHDLRTLEMAAELYVFIGLFVFWVWLSARMVHALLRPREPAAVIPTGAESAPPG